MFRTLIATVFLATSAVAQDTPAPEAPMDLSRLAKIIQSLDPDATYQGTNFQLEVADVPVIIITDPTADRMRAMVPIRSANDMTPEEVMRVLQANFDSALDARYAVANGRLWAVFIHPLRPLEKDQFISAIGQTINVAKTYGSLYTGGAMQFGGGDSGGLQRELIDNLLKRGEEI